MVQRMVGAEGEQPVIAVDFEDGGVVLDGEGQQRHQRSGNAREPAGIDMTLTGAGPRSASTRRGSRKPALAGETARTGPHGMVLVALDILVALAYALRTTPAESL